MTKKGEEKELLKRAESERSSVINGCEEEELENEVPERQKTDGVFSLKKKNTLTGT